MIKFIGLYSDYEIWTNGFNYYITDVDHAKKSRDYDKIWYIKRAIDQNNIEWSNHEKNNSKD